MRLETERLLELRDFACVRDGEPLFKPVSHVMSAGDVVQVAGPNGAGKTTLLRSLCGLFDSFEGEILFEGSSLSRSRHAFLSQLLYLGHQPGVKKSLTARENLEWFAGVNGFKQAFDVRDVLSKVGLAGYEDIPCHQMSAGQHRRVGLARLYFDRSPIWVLDEPFTAIDIQGVARLEALIESRASEGGLVVLTTHQALSIKRFHMLTLEKPARSTYA